MGFNEPGSSFGSRTRVKTLNEGTIKDNWELFFKKSGYDITDVPVFAITMGVGTIMEAKKIYLFASGENKAEVLAEAIEGPVTNRITASKLQEHPNLTVIVDKAAASRLKNWEYYHHVNKGEDLLVRIQEYLGTGGINDAREAQKKFAEEITQNKRNSR